MKFALNAILPVKGLGSQWVVPSGLLLDREECHGLRGYNRIWFPYQTDTSFLSVFRNRSFICVLPYPVLKKKNSKPDRTVSQHLDLHSEVSYETGPR